MPKLEAPAPVAAPGYASDIKSAHSEAHRPRYGIPVCTAVRQCASVVHTASCIVNGEGYLKVTSRSCATASTFSSMSSSSACRTCAGICSSAGTVACSSPPEAPSAALASCR